MIKQSGIASHEIAVRVQVVGGLPQPISRTVQWFKNTPLSYAALICLSINKNAVNDGAGAVIALMGVYESEPVNLRVEFTLCCQFLAHFPFQFGIATQRHHRQHPDPGMWLWIIYIWGQPVRICRLGGSHRKRPIRGAVIKDVVGKEPEDSHQSGISNLLSNSILHSSAILVGFWRLVPLSANHSQAGR